MMTLTLSHDEAVQAHLESAPVTGPARDRASRSMGGIARLFSERPELRGVLPSADLADDAIRWSA